jgi:hypothetical protein
MFAARDRSVVKQVCITKKRSQIMLIEALNCLFKEIKAKIEIPYRNFPKNEFKLLIYGDK